MAPTVTHPPDNPGTDTELQALRAEVAALAAKVAALQSKALIVETLEDIWARSVPRSRASLSLVTDESVARILEAAP